MNRRVFGVIDREVSRGPARVRHVSDQGLVVSVSSPALYAGQTGNPFRRKRTADRPPLPRTFARFISISYLQDCMLSLAVFYITRTTHACVVYVINIARRHRSIASDGCDEGRMDAGGVCLTV